MRGQVIYVIHHLRSEERNMVAQILEEYPMRILWQQFTDGLLTFRHYGVDMGDGTVVHFCGDRNYIQQEAWIKRSCLVDFCAGACPHQAREVRYCFAPETVVRRAMSQVGGNFGGYNFLLNNCEHFANWCACGKKISRQVMMR